MNDESAALAARTDKLTARLGELELDALLVLSIVDIRYLSGFIGDQGDAALLIGAQRRPYQFFSDFRYETQSAEQVPADLFERRIVSGELIDALVGALGQAGGRLGFAEAATTVKTYRRLQEALPSGWELVGGEDEVARLRAVKDRGEVEKIRAAAQLADEALSDLLEGGIVGRSEQQVAFELETSMRRLGAEELSFPSIVASGAHAALPHAHPRDVAIFKDVLVTIDWGAQLEGYCSDCTRTYATGEHLSERAREVYGLVLAAEGAGLDAVRTGIGTREADAAAREVIERAGEGERFGHGLGHGVGLEVHEAPRLSRHAPEQPLQAGNVVTIEPGIYLPGELGVRIEDLVVVGDDGAEVLTHLPKVLTVVP